MGILDRENLEPRTENREPRTEKRETRNPLENCEYSLVAILDITTGKRGMINDNP
jgi:hypothetical protein